MPGLLTPLVGQGVAAVAAVVGLDPADRGDQLPGDVAGLVGGVDDLRAALVGGEGRGGDAVAGGAGDDRVGGALGDGGGDHAGDRDARGGLDRLGGDRGAVGEVAVLVVGAEAVALELTRLAVHTPDSSARGTRVIALLRRDNGLLVMCVLSPLVSTVPVRSPPSRRHVINDVPRAGHAQTRACDPRHSAPACPAPRAARPLRLCPDRPTGHGFINISALSAAAAATGGWPPRSSGRGECGCVRVTRRAPPSPRLHAPRPPSGSRAPTGSRPGGVNSPVRAFNAVGGTPRFMASGHGRVAARRRRQRVRRPDLLLGTAAAGPRPSRGRGRGRPRR